MTIRENFANLTKIV